MADPKVAQPKPAETAPKKDGKPKNPRTANVSAGITSITSFIEAQNCVKLVAKKLAGYEVSDDNERFGVQLPVWMWELIIDKLNEEIDKADKKSQAAFGK